MSQSKPLPYGWQVETSKTHPDRVYYFNRRTGSTTWKCPELDYPRRKVTVVKTASKQVARILPSKPSQVHEKIIKYDPSVTPNSQTDILDHSSFCLTDDSSMTSVPSTAVQNESSMVGISILGNTFTNKVDDEARKSSLKRKSDTLNGLPTNNVRKSAKLRAIKGKENTDKNVVKIMRPSNDSGRRSLEVKPEVIEIPLESTSGNYKDVKMLDVSLDLDDLTAKRDCLLLMHFYIVMDTNVLISNLDMVKELKDVPINGCGPPHLFLPDIVVEELSRLKNKKDSKAMEGAQKAMFFLNKISKSHPRFHMQSPAEIEEWTKSYSKVNDDKILDCCVGLINKMPREKVILLTNDRNLVNKALICNITVHNCQSMMESVKPDIMFSCTNENENKKSVETVDTKEQEENSLKFKLETHALMCTARQLLKNVLAKLLEEEMFRVYGDSWLTFHIQKNLLEGILKSILKNWEKVFAQILTKDDKQNLQLLLETAVRPEGFLADKDECLMILSIIEAVFCQILKKRPHLTVEVETLKEFRFMCIEAYYKYCDIEKSIRAAEDRRALAIFQTNWEAVNNLCGMLHNHFQVPHEFQYSKPNEFPGELKIKTVLCKLHLGVQQLKTSMFRLLDALQKSMPTKVFCKELHEELLYFIPSLGIKEDTPATPAHLSVKAWEQFCTHPRNREMMEVGYNQIEGFFYKLGYLLQKF